MPRATVVLVHGLWMNGLEMSLLRRRLERCGFRARIFSYSSAGAAPVENAARLQRFITSLDSDVVHFVGHSLGGLVILQLFRKYPHQRPGRVVLLGTPVAGSRVATRLGRNAFTRRLFGRSLDHGLLGDGPGWAGGRDLGIVAGTLSVGLGRWVTALPGPSDGTVALCETQLAGATDRYTAPVTHMGLLFSARVAAQVCAFLNTGRFGSNNGRF